jgi:WXG100 family type VII secretion target
VSEFRVDLGGLLAVVDAMSQFEQQMDAQLACVDATVKPLKSSWIGEAAQAATAAQTLWSHGAQQMRAAVGLLRGIAEGAHANYSGAAQTNTENWT